MQGASHEQEKADDPLAEGGGALGRGRAPRVGELEEGERAQPTPPDDASPFSLQNVVIPLILMGAATAFGFLMLGRQGLL
ncbi:hypothetical protein GMI69_08330 [Eggerthellaceae bacterium zg-887]|uniref:hypothetical protein n=1 Tax=Xiamenia xianingshaonis TaxID=2682776 RepID=UPI0013EE313C|nr:hypothetical protein [Xiamenia xianingshaonis]NGM18206.1 hypothetical protein [Eggerthellaceae bacterium zg-893]NHM16659.1 hypothetical protein [Xiamenia xianingshaonis]